MDIRRDLETQQKAAMGCFLSSGEEKKKIFFHQLHLEKYKEEHCPGLCWVLMQAHELIFEAKDRDKFGQALVMVGSREIRLGKENVLIDSYYQKHRAGLG